VTRERPFGVTILAILAAIGALLAAYHTLQYLGLVAFHLGPMAFFGFNFWGALLWGVCVLCWLWAMRALWAMEAQGWMFVVLISGFNLIMAALSILGASTFQALLPAILVNGAILLYCLVPSTKEAFARP
jgi:hypothetical protein